MCGSSCMSHLMHVHRIDASFRPCFLSYSKRRRSHDVEVWVQEAWYSYV